MPLMSYNKKKILNFIKKYVKLVKKYIKYKVEIENNLFFQCFRCISLCFN